MRSARILYTILFLLLLVCYVLMSARILDPFAGAIDLGRHLRDGEYVLSSQAWRVLHSNFYSYTYPEAPFVNHHWLAALIFFLVWKCAGFVGLNVSHTALGAVTFLIFFRMARQAAGFPFALALSLLLMPLLRTRPSIRPEIFTFLMCGIFLALLWREHQSVSPAPLWKKLLLFVGLQILWVNLHSGFVFGPFFAGAFLFSELIEPRKWDDSKRLRIRRWSTIFMASLAACVVNPSGIRGALYPLTLLSSRSFPVGENLSITTFLGLGQRIELIPIALALGFLAATFALTAWKRRFVLPLFLLAATAAVLTWEMYRNHPLLGYLALAITSLNLKLSGMSQTIWNNRIAAAVLGATILAGFCLAGSRLANEKDSIGFGLKAGRNDAADFVRANGVQGPIFNNFDVGGYVVYHLFPEYRVYVDSRAEAYPADFLENGYILPLQSEPEWERVLAAYQFNAILFCRVSHSEDDFLVRRMLDPAWAVVFLDDAAVILLRRIPPNQDIVSRFEIPRERLPLKQRDPAAP